jgi:hypothetical protein
MASLTIQTENVEDAIHLIQSALLKESAFLRLGIEKTRARIANFEKKYGCPLQGLRDSTKEIDDLDLVEWEGEIEVLRRLNKKLKQVDELKICR